MGKTKAGLLPLYIQLYDDTMPALRPRIEQIRDLAAFELEKRGLEIIRAPVCRLDAEFRAAVKAFEDSGADAIITVHLAYSPSLEAIGALTSTKLPLIVLDTTPAFDFSERQDPDETLYNHGIHGVQDLCNLLKRNGKGYHIAAGHIRHSDVADRAAALVKACGRLRDTEPGLRALRIGIVGNPFTGMGDFQVPADILESKEGVEIIQFDCSKTASYLDMITASDIAAEISQDYLHYDVMSLSRETHEGSAHVNLAIRTWMETERLDGFTVNFQAIGKSKGLQRMPYLEAGKAMARGIGYAGEGDLLTSAFIGKLLRWFPDTTFTEMFCPDWKNNSIFMSHSGEMNIKLASEKPVLTESGFSHTDALPSAVAYGRLKSGRAVFASLSPAAGDSLALIYREGCMKEVHGEDNMKYMVRGWFDPLMPISAFLEKYSQAGGIHHGAMIYGDAADTLEALGHQAGWDVIRL